MPMGPDATDSAESAGPDDRAGPVESRDFHAAVQCVVDRIEGEGRDAARADVRMLFNAGVASEDDLFALVENPSGDPARRAKAFWLLARLRTPGTAPALLRALDDADAALRAAVARSLGESSLEEAAGPLAGVLRDDADAEVRKAAAYALGLLGQPASVAPLVAALQGDASPAVRGMAAEALSDVGDPAAIEPLIAAFGDGDPAVRFWAVFSVGALGDEAAIAALQQVAQHDDGEAGGYGAVRAEAAEAIGRIRQRIGQRPG